MHLTVYSGYRSIFFEDYGSIVIQTRRTAFEGAGDNHHTVLGCSTAVNFNEITRERLRQGEVVDVFCLTEIERIVELGENHKLSAVRGEVGDSLDIASAVPLDVRGKEVLDYADFDFSGFEYVVLVHLSKF